MKTNNFWRDVRSIGIRTLTGGLLVCATQTPVVFGQPQAVNVVVEQQAVWNQAVESAELAWLGNPATFHEDLTASISGDFLEIRGSVSTDATRMLAMRLAREASRMPVADHTETSSGPGAAAQNRGSNLVNRDAVQVLYHALPQISRAVTVVTLDRGEVVVRGEVATLEDKLAVSRCLKVVPGCNCVKNQLRTRLTAPTATTSTMAAKPQVQDNSLLARLGLVQPRTEVVSTSPTFVHTYPARDAIQPANAKPVLVSLPVAPPQSRPEAAPENGITRSNQAVEPIMLTSASTAFDGGKLCKTIAETCGIEERAVKVVGGGAKTLTISLTVADVETGRTLAAKVLALPELVPFGVSLDISLAR